MQQNEPESWEWLRKAASELEEVHLEAVVDDIEHAVRDGIAAYAGLTKAAGFREGIERTMRIYCRTLADRRPLNDREHTVLNVIGAQRARHGLRPDDMTRAVDVGVGAGWPWVLGALRGLGADVDTVHAVAAGALPATMRFTSELKAALVAGHHAEHEERLPAQIRAQATVIERLLDGDKSDDELYGIIRSQSLDIRPPCGVLLVTTRSPRVLPGLRRSARAIAAVCGAIEGPGRPSSATPHVVLVVRRSQDAWREMLAAVDDAARGEDVFVLSSDTPVNRLCELAALHGALEADLALAPRARRGPGVVTQEQLDVCRLLSHMPAEDRIDFVTRRLGRVLAEARRGGEFVRAYEAWLESDGNDTVAAARLDEQVHTLRYRLKRLQALTGIRIRSGAGRVQLDLAVMLYRGWVEPVLADHDVR